MDGHLKHFVPPDRRANAWRPSRPLVFTPGSATVVRIHFTTLTIVSITSLF